MRRRRGGGVGPSLGLALASLVTRKASVVVGASLAALLALPACGTDRPDRPPERPPRLRPSPPAGLPAPPGATATPPPRPASSGLVAGAPVADPTPAPGQRDREPNDGPEAAIPLAPGQQAVGFLDPPDPDEPLVGDQDWYVVEIPGARAPVASPGSAIVRAELTGASDLDVVLEWMDGTGASPRVLARADVHEKRPGPELLPALRMVPGRAYFRVREAWYKGQPRTGSARPYGLRVLVSPWEPGVEAEPNDAAATAGTVPWGRAAQGTFGHARDLDLWRLELPEDAAGKQLLVSLTGVAGVAPELTLSWGDDAPPVLDGRAEAGHGVRLRAVMVPDGARALLVAAQARSGAAPALAYTLRAELEAPAEGALEREPNDSALLATPLTLGGGEGEAPEAAILGFVDASDDVDHFRLALARPATLHASLSPPLEADLELLVLPVGGDGPRWQVDEGRAGAAELVRGLGLEAGEWDLVVRGRRGSFDAHRPYRLEVSLGDPEREEAEPNGDRLDLGVKALGPASGHKGWLFPAGDRDCWKVESRATGQDRVPVTLAIEAPPDLALALHVYDPDGVLVGAPNDVPKVVPGATEATFTYAFGAGTYTVRVSASEQGRADPRAPYHLKVLD